MIGKIVTIPFTFSVGTGGLGVWGQGGVTRKDSKPQLLSSVMPAFYYLHVNISLGFLF